MCTTLSAAGSEILRRMKTKFDAIIVDEVTSGRAIDIDSIDGN